MITQPPPPASNTMVLHQPDERFDIHQVERFRTVVNRATGDVVVDLRQVRFLDAAAMNALVEARSMLLEAGAELWLDGLSQTARITLELAGLADSLPMAEFLSQVAA